MNEEEIKALVRKTILEGLTVDLEHYQNSSYNDKGFKLTVKLNGEEVANDYIYLNE